LSITIATGTQLAIASTYGTSVNMTAITNAAEAVATLGAGHGVVVGDFLEITSGWDLLNNRIVRAKTVATNDITFESINTTSVTNYPAGSGVGTVRRITAWTSIAQVQSFDTSGGDLNFADITTIVDKTQKQVPTTRSPQQLTITVFDDPTLGYYSAVQSASDTNSITAFRIIFPNNSRMVANGYWSVGASPTVAVNAPLTNTISFSAAAQLTRYAT
jgi:Phage tail tube protein, TTP